MRQDIVSKTEYEILTELKEVICNPEVAEMVKCRLAEIILEGNRENIMFKRFENDKEYDYFLKRLESITERKDIIKTARKKVTIYNPNKNKVYIKDDDGVIKDIMEVSSKIRDISICLSYVMVDLDQVYGIDWEEEKNIRSLFLDNPVEIEKKFIFGENESNSIYDNSKEIVEILKAIPGVQIKTFDEWNKIENEDQYFEALTQLPKGVAMRHRTTGAEKSYYVKMPADDGTSITKRHENKYHCQSREEFLELCELKEGDDISLWYLSKHLKNNGFVETNESKETRAKNALGIE